MRLGAAGAGGATVFAAACSGAASTLEPHGPGAAAIADLTWLVVVFFTLVYLVVLGALLYAARRHRGETGGGDAATERVGIRWMVVGGVLLPLTTLTALFVVTMQTLGALNLPAERMSETVEVAGELWWWRVRYPGEAPGEAFETANEIHVPVGEPVAVRLHSENVIHSFWVPELQGKLDLIPGRTNVTWIQADSPGVYLGKCAEYCGLQHAHMAFVVVAEPRAAYEAWLAAQRRPAREPDSPRLRRGREAFERSACAGCHAVRGTAAAGRLGPDLTHLASRRTLAAGMLENTKGHLGGWIANPQVLKPGNKMPQVPLEPEAFGLILDYLQSLR